MELEEFLKQLSSQSDSKVSVKLEQNSRGTNATVHVYQGVTKAQIDDAVKMAKYALAEAMK